MTNIVNNNYKDLLQNSECGSPLSATLIFSVIKELIEPGTSNNIFNVNNTFDANYLISLKNYFDSTHFGENEFKTENFVIVDNNYKITGDSENKIATLAKFKYDVFTDTSHQELNEFISEFTKNTINDFFKSSLINCRILMFNVSYFNAAWKNKFTKTQKENFTTSNNNIIEVDMMHCVEDSWYYENDQIQLYYKKYEDGTPNSIVFILPKEGPQSYDIDNLEHHVKETIMCRVDVKIPKFKQICEIEKDAILSLRVVKKDSEEEYSDHPITFHQKCVIEIDETKTCAAVATGLIAKCYTPPTKMNVVFHANKPFYYFIRNNYHKLVLFSGKYGF
ncbi:serpin [Hokovirus HKV1]|uniref:Serpin n=1 Tax=Hokovirus HKV1 TaxID=1977638 RepID=A0A1V0SEL6_9VIRU|nr:serpin [Hokovirus HKV1]